MSALTGACVPTATMTGPVVIEPAVRVRRLATADAGCAANHVAALLYNLE